MNKLMLLPILALAACAPTYESRAPAKVLKPVEKCGYVQIPEYGILDRPASDGEIAGGAIAGAIIGGTVSDDPVGAIIGGIIGGNVAAGNRKQEQVITGYKKVYRCQTVYE